MLKTVNRLCKKCARFTIVSSKCVKNVRGASTRPTSFFASEMRSEETTTEAGLTGDLYAKIKACGPMTIADYMKEVLTHPTRGYYMKRDVFGTGGDFVTSPEITQLFGEMIGIWVINELTKITRDSFQLVELGPGRGTLSKVILKVLKQFKMIDRVSLHLVEISPALSLIQAKNLCVSTEEVSEESCEDRSVSHYREGLTDHNVRVFWYRSIRDVPENFSVFVAHEFFDALPIHKFQRAKGVWSEVLVDIDAGSANEAKFRYVATKGPTPASKVFVSPNEKRDHVEVSPQTIATIDYLAFFLEEFGGFALIIDYGHIGEKTDTFRSYRKHEQHDPLVDPGTADLTADVDFSLIDKIGRKGNRLVSFGPVEQRSFLKQMGIDVRLRILLKNANESEKTSIESGYRMIMDDDKMGKCFKVFSFFPSVLEDHLSKFPVAGFDATLEAPK